MSDPEALAMKAAATVVTELVKGGGKALTDWLKRRCSRTTVEAAAALAADPGVGGARKVLEGSLQMDLEKSPSLAGELRGLLSQGTVYAPQTAIASRGSMVTQIQGNDNGALEAPVAVDATDQRRQQQRHEA